MARWPFVVVGVVALVVLGYLSWTWLGGILDRRAAAQAGECRQGELTMRVVVTPSVFEPLNSAAIAWNGQRPVIDDYCLRADVQALDSASVLTALTQGWDTSKLGQPPSAWLPESSLWVNQLRAQNRSLLGAAAESIGNSPVVLAVPEAAAQPLRSGRGFRWSEIPELLSAPDGWKRFGVSDWGRFTMGVPDLVRNPASALALQCALASAGKKERGPVTVDMLNQPAVRTTLSQVAKAKVANVPPTTQDALVELSKTPDLTTSPYDAVPVLEIDLFRRNLGKDGGPKPERPLYGIPAAGPAPAADFPLLPLSGEWINDAQVRAAQKFSDYLREPNQEKVLAQESGVRVRSTNDRPRTSPGITWLANDELLAPADENTTQQLAASWASSVDNGQTVTVLVDVSGSMNADGGGGKSRMDWLKAALRGQVDRSVSGSMGMWEFSRSLDGKKPYRQLVPTKGIEQQRNALRSAVDGLKPVSATQLYSSLAVVYRSAVENYEQGRTNRIVVLTDGPNDGGLNLQQLQAELDKVRNPNKKVAISFITIGPDPERAPLTKIAQSTGGSVSVAEDGAAIDPALGQLLSAG
ncbi:substrate-binding domain-containing protein [Crossiella sp. CA-258035]|uniref:substrate-binding domain-containing protein n=1 Tax=Crossiella sp. CA-258035 TaxID=2981138 RepID=UPI0024BC2B01|nr:substrate-binding domain-containing protein [Crossiella sp. CA-258035]WHT22055.1 substrate-binding domain-containing protein [Crossiella sp. CA-258035]